MAYDLAKVTDAGNNLVASILANKSSLSIDKIEVSDTQLPSTTDITKLTSISDVVQTIQANGFLKNENTLTVSSVLDNSKITADYKAWVFGIWGSDSQNGQSMLMAVITATNAPDTIPAYSGSTPVSYTYKFNIGFSNAGNVQFNMINGSFATNDTVVHTTGDETIDGQKKFKTDPTDGAGNAYAKTVDVNQQLDKKVNVADMRKPASDVAGIEEVNAKQDKIGYTPADDSKVAHLSGANNFDTVPTVNNNPLLLASSLPSDLARTGQAQTFTAAQTFSIAPTIKDASKDKGDNQAATMADLKSLENSAWIQLDKTNGTDELALCRVDGNKLWVVWGFYRETDNGNGNNYSIGKVPQSIQGKNFSGFNAIFEDSLSALDCRGSLSISSNSVMAAYTGYTGEGGYSMYGYFTFN